MFRWKYFLRSNSRAIFWWLFFLVIGGYVAYKRSCLKSNASSICQFQNFGPEHGVLVLVVVLVFILLLRGAKRLIRPRNPGSFTDDPQLYHKQIIVLEGRVVKILTDGAFEKLKRKTVDAYRTYTDNPDPKGRFIHQRFLMNSRILRSGHVILVEHNTDYGKLPLKKGDMVRVKGEYLHPEGRRRKQLYGRIHFTHAPKGEIMVQW